MKRLFYFLILMGAFTVTQPGCGLLFFPLPDDGDADDPIVVVHDDPAEDDAADDDIPLLDPEGDLIPVDDDLPLT